MRAYSLALGLAGVLGAGCSSSSAPTRTVTGQLTSSAMVTAQSADQQAFDGTMAAGRFTLQLPTGTSYQLTVGKAHILWPTAQGGSRWARLGDGAALDLGHVHKRSDGDYDCDHKASSGDHCDRDDGMNDADGGDHDDYGHDDGDHDDHGGSYGGKCDGGMNGGGGAGGGGGTGGPMGGPDLGPIK